VTLYAELAHELGTLMLSADRTASRERHSSAGNLERMAYHALDRLAEHGPMRPSALAELVCLDLSTVSRHLAALERVGYVERERDPDDGRAQLVRVSERGVAKLAAVRSWRRDRMRSLVGHWPAADRQELVRLLSQLNVELRRVEHARDITRDRGAR